MIKTYIEKGVPHSNIQKIFERNVQLYEKKGWRISSTSCGLANTTDNCNNPEYYWQVILVKD